MEILDHNSSMMRAKEEGIAQEKENNFLVFVKKGLSVKMVAPAGSCRYGSSHCGRR